MVDHFNFSNSLLHNIDNEVPITFNLSTPSIKKPRATKNSSINSVIEHYTNKKL